MGVEGDMGRVCCCAPALSGFFFMYLLAAGGLPEPPACEPLIVRISFEPGHAVAGTSSGCGCTCMASVEHVAHSTMCSFAVPGGVVQITCVRRLAVGGVHRGIARTRVLAGMTV